MKYKGYEITKQFLPGSDFKIDKNGNTRYAKPKSADVDHYWAEHMITGETLVNCSSVAELKELIRLMNYLEKHACLPDGGSC